MITINGRTLYAEDVRMFLEWFVTKMGRHSKLVMDKLVDGSLVIADIDGVMDELIGNVYTDLNEVNNEIKRLEKLNETYAKTIDEQAKIIRGRNVDVIESRLMYAEKLLDKIGMSLNYRENVK